MPIDSYDAGAVYCVFAYYYIGVCRFIFLSLRRTNVFFVFYIYKKKVDILIDGKIWSRSYYRLDRLRTIYISRKPNGTRIPI